MMYQLLPLQYQGQDINRLTLAYFSISGLDLLHALHSVIEHRPYDHKADVFSFGIVLWELLTGKLPYEHLTPLQAAVGVVQKGLRPKIPRHTHPNVVELLERCWEQNPSLRPEFSEIIDILQDITNTVLEEERTVKRSRQLGESC